MTSVFVNDPLFFRTQGLRAQVFIEFSQVFIVFCMFTNKHSSHIFADKYKKVRGFFFLFLLFCFCRWHVKALF